MRFDLYDDESERRAEYGFDPVLGFFAEVWNSPEAEEPESTYDSFCSEYDHACPLLGVLDFLVSEGFFKADDLEEALAAHSEDRAAGTRGARIALEVLENLKAASD